MREPSWRAQGRDPDYRFSLANERTFLAWIRTALAILAGGILMDQFATSFRPVVVSAVAVGLCALAAILAAMAYRRWRDNEIAMRLGASLPSNIALPFLAISMSGAAAVIGWLILTR